MAVRFPSLSPLRSLPLRRQKAFFDSPGLLEQSHHWGASVIWVIAAGTSAALLWAFFGKVDQTVVAAGTLEPVVGTVPIKSPSGGIVRRLMVREGQLVQAGTALAEVENEGLLARLQTVRKQLALLRYENQLYNLLLDRNGRFSAAALPEPPLLVRDEDKTRSIQLTVQQSAAQLRQLQARLASQRRTLQLKRELTNSMRTLYSNGGMAKFNYLSQVDELQRLESEISQTREQTTAVLAATGRQVSTNQRQILDLEAQLVGLQESDRNLLLRAQAAGRVFNLQVGRGSVIGQGAEVLRLVPEGSLRAKLYLANADVGFVREGQVAKLAVSSFPPGEYGYLNGTVSRIGANALTGDESASPQLQQRANTFPMVVTLQRNPGKERLLQRLQPGMQVSANIVVRQRPVINLLTDVFTKGADGIKNSR